NSLLARKIPYIFPAWAQKIPCSPAQGILPQAPKLQGLFDADFRERGRIPCCLPAAHLAPVRACRLVRRGVMLDGRGGSGRRRLGEGGGRRKRDCGAESDQGE